MSLTVKLQRRCDSLSTDQIKLIARRLPRDMDALETILSKEEISIMGESVLSITQKHERNQERFDECVRELRAFSSSGLYAMHLLNKVHPLILDYYGMQGEKWEVLSAAGVSIDFQTGKLIKSE